MAFDNPHDGTFNAAQIKIAGNYVELELERILRDTIGNGWNKRQMSLIAVLGSTRLEQESGAEISPQLVSEMENGLITHFGKTRPVIRKDIQELIEDGLIEKPLMEGSKRDKTLQMSDDGFASWREYNERRAALFVAAGKTIEKLGGIPSFWMRTIKNMIRRFFKGSTGMVATAMFVTGGSSLLPSAAQAWELNADLYETAPVIVIDDYDFRTKVYASFGQEPIAAVRDTYTARFLEWQLPKGPEMNAWQRTGMTYQASPAINIVDAYDAGNMVQAAVWNDAQDPMDLLQDTDAASFLEQYLPKGPEMNAWQRTGMTYQASPVGWGL